MADERQPGAGAMSGAVPGAVAMSGAVPGAVAPTEPAADKHKHMIDPYATHIYPLVVCAANTAGPIFEHGCGHYSTPILRAVAPLREIYCLENDQTYRESLDWLPGITWVDRVPDMRFGFAFVDGAPAETRVTVCNKVDASIILLHDVEKPKYYRLINLRPFRYQFVFKIYTKWTMAMSDTIDVQALLQSHISDIDQQEIPLKPLPLPV